MKKQELLKVYKEAYNNFDPRPLQGEMLQKFYVEDTAKEFVKQITDTIKMTEKHRKILVVGQSRCGKSTIHNKIKEDLDKEYHVVAIDASQDLLLNDIESIDLLLVMYIRVMESMKEHGISDITTPFEKMMEFFKQKLKIEEVGFNFVKTVSLKIKLESESRATIRKQLRTQMNTLIKNLSQACGRIYQVVQKDLLIIIDDLDKLESKFAEEIFFRDWKHLLEPEVKIIYTFPLPSYYSPPLANISGKFAVSFIHLINVKSNRQEEREGGFQALRNTVLQRIDEKMVKREALDYLIRYSGGLLRHLIQFMQDACFRAYSEEAPIIDKMIAQKVVKEKMDENYRLFDFSTYKEDAEKIRKTGKKEDIKPEILIYLLKYLFVLEYKSKSQTEQNRYELHPCLNSYFENMQ